MKLRQGDKNVENIDQDEDKNENEMNENKSKYKRKTRIRAKIIKKIKIKMSECNTRQGRKKRDMVKKDDTDENKMEDGIYKRKKEIKD